MSFPESVATQALVACGRCCCICHKFCGTKMELHHIRQKADGGEDTFENCIPLCFDCHADMGKGDPKHPKGKRYSEAELRGHKERWMKQVANSDTVPGMGQGVSEADKKLFQRICDVFDEDLRSWLRDADLNEIHPVETFQPLKKMMYESEDPFFEFLDSELEKLRGTFFCVIQKFIRYLIEHTYPVIIEDSRYYATKIWCCSRGEVKWDYDDYEQYKEEGRQLNQLATEVWEAYCEFVRNGRQIVL